MASAEKPSAIDIGLGYKLMGPELLEQYAFFENLASGSVACSVVSGSISETENFIKEQFQRLYLGHRNPWRPLFYGWKGYH